ncbi:hypothetical protein ACJJTC_006699 [Scirpophaga incertulas]
MAVNCTKCGEQILRRDFIKCTKCKNFFHLDCTSIGEKFFYLISPESRVNCKCDHCRYTEPSTDNQIITIPISNSFEVLSDGEDYVTQRRKKRSSLPDLTTSFLSVNTEKSSQSLPETSDDPLTRELREKIKNLQTKLEIADNEIINLNIENNKLSETIKKQAKIIQVYKTVGIDDINLSKNGPNNMSTPLRKHITNRNSLRLDCSGNTPTRALSTKAILDQTNCYNINNTLNLSDGTKSKNYGINEKKQKLCIISNIGKNTRSNIIRSHFERLEMEVCHYRIPGGGISQLLTGIDKKLEDYTLKDFCILFLGDNSRYLEKENTVERAASKTGNYLQIATVWELDFISCTRQSQRALSPSP